MFAAYQIFWALQSSRYFMYFGNIYCVLLFLAHSKRNCFLFQESNHKLLEELIQKRKSINKLTFSGSDFRFDFANQEG